MASPLPPDARAEHAAALIRVLLVDDSAEFLESAARFLATDPALLIVGRALSGRDALEQIRSLQPQLVLVDLLMPAMSGLEMTTLVKSLPNAPLMIMLTPYGVSEYGVASQAAHADGWVAKSEFGTELLPLIHTLFDCPGPP